MVCVAATDVLHDDLIDEFRTQHGLLWRNLFERQSWLLQTTRRGTRHGAITDEIIGGRSLTRFADAAV